MKNWTQKHTLTVVLVALAVLIVAGGGMALREIAYEEVEVEVREPPSGEAKRNPYLALERLLSRFDHDVVTVRKLSEPESYLTTVILADPDDNFSPEQVDAWEQWVSEGGHLIMSQPGESADEKTAPLLARLGFSVAGEDQEWPYEIEVASHEIDYLDEETPELRWIAQDADWLLFSGPDKPFAASRPVESGRVTVVGAAAIFDNQTIGKGEHATLAVRALELPEPTANGYENITIVMYGARQSWMFYVLSHIWPFVLLVFVALLLAIRGGTKRFGPLLPDPPTERRSRREHVDAVGRFLWDQGAIASLVEATQAALMAELEHRRPTLAQARGSERNEIIADELDITPDEARELFRKPSGNRNAETFTERIRTLEHHRRKL